MKFWATITDYEGGKVINRMIKLSISFLFFITHKCITVVLYALEKRCWGGLVVLEYHSVKSRQRGKFARQMDILLEKSHPVSADIEGPLGNGQLYVAVTFDDGFQSVVENALPELRKRGIPAALFADPESPGHAYRHRVR